MPDPAHSKTRATAAIAASVLTAGTGAAQAAIPVHNAGGLSSSNVQQNRAQRSDRDVRPSVQVEQGAAINPARSQSITVSGSGFLGEDVEKHGIAVYVSEYRKYPLAALSRARAVTMTLVPVSDVHEGSFSTQLTLPAGILDPNQQYVVATAVVNPDLGYSVEDTSYNSWTPLEVQPADTQDEPLNAQILSGQLEIPQEQNLIVYKATGLGDAQAFEIMTSIYAVDEQGNRHVLAASPARADVVNGTLLDGIEVPGARLAVLQDVHPDLRYVLNVEIAPSASRGLAAQSVEIPFTNGWSVAETAAAEPADEEVEEVEAQAEETPAAPRPATSKPEASEASTVPAEEQDPVLPETDPRRHYDLPRNTRFDRVRDASADRAGEQESAESTNHSSVAVGARLRVEEAAVPENDSEKTLTFTGEGLEGSGPVALQVHALDSNGRTAGEAIASGDARVEDGSFSAQLQVPGNALKPGTTYRVSAVYEDSRGTVQIVTGGFTVERDGVDASRPSESLPAEQTEAPATEEPSYGDSAAEKPTEEKPSVTPSDSAPAPAEESKESAPAAVASEAPVSYESASPKSAPVTEGATGGATDRAGQKPQKATASASKGEREQLAATGTSGMLTISAVGSLSLVAGAFLTRRGRRDVQLTSRS
ncbi:LPXTG cell wall anchor domain-containing protein [uncultured Rothia sp.]|uniref:LPXTG cell wall anchor domain-containing protein n=1 Tax=uncultured Rothia sp. TaxID=316088 RepID=UPI0028DBAF2F|nr:LPXTG cell wall anchor domain-containing protein [uncultured Rothia sp.]